jgi:hypothetical protein
MEDLMDNRELGLRISELLNGWAGWDDFSRVLRRYSDFHVCVVGGSVRDILLQRQRPPKDFDFIVHGSDWSRAIEELGKTGELKRTPFGSPRWFPSGTDVYADIMNVKDWNGLWPCENVIDCLNVFDFTANAIAYDLGKKDIYDPQNGRRDINRRQIRAIRFDWPDNSISSTLPLSRSAMLWYRLLHYAQKLDLKIEPVTFRWLTEHRHYLSWKAEFSLHFFEPQLDLLSQMDPDDIAA